MPDIHEVRNGDLLFKDFAKYFLDEGTTDVVFVVEGEKIPAHKMMLAPHSDHFHTLLFEKSFKEAQQKEIELKETSLPAFRIILEYFYKGMLNLETYEILTVLEVLELSNRYKLEALKDRISKFLELKVSENDVTKVLEVAEMLELKAIEEKCMWILAMAVEGIYDVEVVLELETQFLKKLLIFCSEKVSALKLFRIAISLLKKNSSAQRQETYDQMKLDIKEVINYAKIPVKALYGEVQKSNIFSSDEFISLTERLHSKGWLEKALKIPDKNLMNELDCPKIVKSQPNILDLGRTMLINNIQFDYPVHEKLFDGKLEVSTDLENWIKVYGGNHSAYSKQNIYLSEIGARYIKILGKDLSDEVLKQIYETVEVSYVSQPPPYVAGYVWTKEVIPRSSYLFYIYDENKEWQLCEELLNNKVVEKTTPFISQKLCFQDSNDFFVIFDQPYLLNSFRFRLWDFDGRKVSYKITVRSDTLDTVSDKTDELVDGWQVVTFSPRPVLQILISCTKTTIGDDFRIYYFEAPAQPDDPIPFRVNGRIWPWT